MPFVKKLDVLIREFGDYVEFQNDIWAESTFLGMWWTYYACLDGIIYNITEWANCPVSLMNITCIRLRLGRFTLCNGGYGFLFFCKSRRSFRVLLWDYFLAVACCWEYRKTNVKTNSIPKSFSAI